MAYGSKGDKLEGKKFALDLSIGDKKESYTHGGSAKFTVDEVISIFKASAIHVAAIVLPYFAVFGSSFQATDEEINQSAKDSDKSASGYENPNKLPLELDIDYVLLELNDAIFTKYVIVNL